MTVAQLVAIEINVDKLQWLVHTSNGKLPRIIFNMETFVVFVSQGKADTLEGW